MKITAISDIHGLLPEISPCDVLLICGDIVPLDIQSSTPKSEMWLGGEFAQWINNLPCQHVIAVWGNHDFIGMHMGDNTLGKQRFDICLGKPTKYKIEFLDGNYTNVIVGDEEITIWGSPWCKPFGTWAFMMEEESLIDRYKSMPKNCDIVITHEAPKIGKMGLIQQGPNTGFKAGTKVLTDIIKDRQPKYALSGHIHSSEHKLSQYKGAGDTLFATVSLLDEQYKHTYQPLTFDI